MAKVMGIVTRLTQAWHLLPTPPLDDVAPADVAGHALVIGIAQGKPFAMARLCVHRGADLACGIVSKGSVVCPSHGWRFSTATGCHDQSPAMQPVFPVEQRADGYYVELPNVPDRMDPRLWQSADALPDDDDR